MTSNSSPSWLDASLWWSGGDKASQQIENGHRFMVTSRYERAVECFRAAIALEPHNADAHGRLAIALLELDLVGDADAVSVLAYAMWPDLTPILQVRGAVLCALGRREEGIELLRQAALREPERNALMSFWGGALYKEGRYEEATDAARTTLRRDPQDWCALLLLSLCLVSQNPTAPQRREVNASMRLAFEIAPHHSMTHAVLGACYTQVNQPDAARCSLRKALQIEPQNRFATHWIHVLDQARAALN